MDNQYIIQIIKSDRKYPNGICITPTDIINKEIIELEDIKRVNDVLSRGGVRQCRLIFNRFKNKICTN